jgi:thioredoxin-related protein
MTTVKFDESYCFNKLIPAMDKFWSEVLALKENKDHTPTLELTKSDKLDMSDDKMLENLVEKYKVTCKELEQKTAYRDELKKMIFKSVNHKNVICNNVQIQSIDVKGRSTIDFKKYVSDNSYIIPDTYIKTGKPSVTRKITIKKEE